MGDVDVEENDTASAVRAPTTKVLREKDVAEPVMINTAIAIAIATVTARAELYCTDRLVHHGPNVNVDVC